MIHRFPTFEIDEPRREVRSGGEVAALQPRVFDLLLYLVKNRDRVVPKDELLDVVWADVIVADGSLQRAVSLLRATLERFGAADAVRTYARKGYRFCVNHPAPGTRPAWNAAIAAKRSFAEIDAMAPEELQEWAQHAQCHGRNEPVIAPLEQAVASFISNGENRRAAWIATLLAQVRMDWRDFALASGWYNRARRLLKGEPVGREHGYLGFLGARFALMQSDLDAATELGRETYDTGIALKDANLQSLGLLCIGETKILQGSVREGLDALEEAGIAVAADGLSPWAGALVYCAVIYMCMTRSDWQGAGEWTEQFTRWGEDKGLTSYPGLCRMHRAEVLTVRGRLREAEEEIRLSHEIAGRNSPWVEGEIWRVQGETMLAQGDLTGARTAFAKALEAGWPTQLEVGLVHIAEGNPAAAVDTISRGLAENAYSCIIRRGRALCALIIAASRAGNLDEARAAFAEVQKHPDLTSTPGLQNTVLTARAELAVAEGNRPEAIRLLREAIRTAMAMEATLAAAHSRCRLATLLAENGDHEFARLELQAAETLYEEAPAHLKRVQAELRKLKKA